MPACVVLAEGKIYKRSRRVMFWMLISTNSCRMNYAMTAWMRKRQQLFDVSRRLKTTSEVVATILQAKVMRKSGVKMLGDYKVHALFTHGGGNPTSCYGSQQRKESRNPHHGRVIEGHPDKILIAGILHEPIKENISILIAAHVFSPPAIKKRV
ncbi:hypothetical protein VPH35_059231 [Triticum aestivum]